MPHRQNCSSFQITTSVLKLFLNPQKPAGLFDPPIVCTCLWPSASTTFSTARYWNQSKFCLVVSEWIMALMAMTLNKMVQLSNAQHSSMLFRLHFFVLSNKSLWNHTESLSLAKYHRQSHVAIHWSQENYCRDGFGSTAFWTEFP